MGNTAQELAGALLKRFFNHSTTHVYSPSTTLAAILTVTLPVFHLQEKIRDL